MTGTSNTVDPQKDVAERKQPASEQEQGVDSSATAHLNDASVAFEFNVRETTGRYTGEKEYARGGMGRILIAYDTILARDIVIKELLPKTAFHTETVEGPACFPDRTHPMMHRFLQEARITGSLEHPSIVPVYELGFRQHGVPYYTMKLVRGKTLAETIVHASSLRERLQLLTHFVSLCQAIAYAHSRGVIHRDLKPANVMIGEYGETVVLDWGLARKLNGAAGGEEHGDSFQQGPLDNEPQGVTIAGQTLGTPMYMSPEQAKGRLEEINERTDVYALGVILYEIITGKTPYTCTTIEEAVKKITSEAPVRIEDYEPEVPPALSAVCARAMAKEPGARYASAVELSEDISRFLSGALVKAYEYRFTEQLRLFVSRYKGRLAIGLATVAALLCVAGLSYVQVTRQRDDANASRTFAEEQQRIAERAYEMEEAARLESEKVGREAARALYNAQIALGANHVQQGRYDSARATLAATPEAWRNWEWGRLQFLCNCDYRSYGQTLKKNINAARHGYTVDVSNNRVVIENAGNNVQLREGFTGEIAAVQVSGKMSDMQACLSASGRWWLVRDRSSATLKNMESGETALEIPLINHWRWSFGFSADDSTMAVRSAPEEVSVYGLKSRQLKDRYSLLGLDQARLSPDGTFLAVTVSSTTSEDFDNATLVFRNVADKTEFSTSDADGITAMEFAPDANVCAVGTGAGDIVLWNPSHREPLWRVHAHADQVAAIAFSKRYVEEGAEKGTVASYSRDGAVCVIEVDAGTERFRVSVPEGKANAIAVSPEGSRIALGVAQHIHVYDAASGTLLQTLRGHEKEIVCLKFNADAKLLYSVTEADVKIWNLMGRGATQAIEAGNVANAALLPGKDVFRTASPDGALQEWRIKNGMPLSGPDYAGPACTETLLDPSGTRMLVKSPEGLALYAIAERRIIAEFPGRNFASAPVAFSPCGRWFALMDADAVSSTGLVSLYENASGQNVKEIHLYARERPWDFASSAMAFAPDGNTLAVTAWNRVIFYSVPQGYEIGFKSIPEQQDNRANCCCFNAQGNRLALSSGNNTLLILDLEDNEEQGISKDASGEITALDFSDDGSRLAVGDARGVVTLRDAASGTELLNEHLLDQAVRFLWFADGDHTLVAGDGRKTVMVRAFPWREAGLPGKACDALALRLEAYKTYQEQTAPAWGICQAHLHEVLEMNRATARGEEATPAFPENRECPEGGVYSLTGDGLPTCSLHGRLHNPQCLLALAKEYEEATPAMQGALRNLLRAALPETDEALREWVNRWLKQQCHEMAALLACEKGMELFPDRDDFASAKLRALLMMERDAEAVQWNASHTISLMDHPDWMIELADALAHQGGEQDVRQAATLLDAYLSKEKAEPRVHALVEILRRSPYWSGLEAAGQVEDWLSNAYESWHQLPWRTSLEAALAAAKSANKLVLLNLTVPDSAAMRQLREVVYYDPQVTRKIPEYFELVALDAESQPELIERWCVTVLPALVFLDSDGTLLRIEDGHDDQNDFYLKFLRDFEDAGRLLEWRIIGPFAPEGCPPLESAIAGTAPDMNAEYPGKAGPVQWRSYTLPRVFDRTKLNDLYDDAMNSAFYGYTCFHLSRRTVVTPDVLAWEAGSVWLDGVKHPCAHGRDVTQDEQAEAVELEAGQHHLLVKAVGRWDVGFNATLKAMNGQALETPGACPLPEAPPLNYLDKRVERRDKRNSATQHPEPDTRHLTINKQQILEEWRNNYGEILGYLNPQPYMEDGNIIGIQTEFPEKIAILASAGFKNGDILTSVNGHTFGGDKSVLEIAALTEGANPYILKVKRGEKEFTYVVHVE
ncbi:MAG TPA: serine/threonine-protein kinase [Candidatus Hydrogenedentes bacterium]|nr:serine/threonine-protein kinase [Candidatus Hydrogenedentota bacterium]